MPSLFRRFPLLVIGAAALVSGCKPPEKPRQAASETPALRAPELARELAVARMDAAKSKSRDEALGMLISALSADPTNSQALAAAETILTETTWNWPVASWENHLHVDQIAFSPPSSLWISLSGIANTTALWDTAALEIRSVLFPAEGNENRALIFDPSHRSVVVQRGDVSLLCDARTLKPIRNLGKLPEIFTPSAVVAFSADGLLIGHPAYASPNDRSIVWHIKDAATGEIIRSSDPIPAGSPLGLAAYVDHRGLRVLQADGSLMEMPISPVDATRNTPSAAPMTLLHAQFSLDGNSALTSQSQGPHQPPVLATLSFSGEIDQSLEPKFLAERFPWSKGPGVWNGLMRESKDAGFKVAGRELKLSLGNHAAIRGKSNITAAAINGPSIMVGEESSTVSVHQQLPPPAKKEVKTPAVSLNQKSLAALRHLAETLSGSRYDETRGEFESLDPAARLKALEECDLTLIQEIFPAFDFTPVAAAIHAIPYRSAPAEAMLPLWNRLALADHTGKSWPQIVALSKDLVGTPWHQELTAAIVTRTSEAPANPTASVWTAAAEMRRIFEKGNSEAILAAIKSAGPKGPAAAAALAESLASEHPEWISACLESAQDLPPLLRKIAKSRIAWLQGRKADALASWPDDFPAMVDFRQREDWKGWEQADFSPALEKMRECMAGELAAITVPENSTPEQRKAVADRLQDPETMAAIGKNRFAHACLQAALAFSTFKEDKETTFQLANLARQLGAPPEPCLRAEALALTALGDYMEAHPRWITLITEHPVETHLPGDYAEAAYTAFENADPRQAMEILTTGIHRFPNDGNFALRAGWVALLTGNSERAYQFLQAGQRIGFPADKIENATALLAIAAAQTGFTDDATVYFRDLIKISSDWADPKTVETLDWPEELKATLRQLTW
jgi:hypothetical protein